MTLNQLTALLNLKPYTGDYMLKLYAEDYVLSVPWADVVTAEVARIPSIAGGAYTLIMFENMFVAVLAHDTGTLSLYEL